MRVTCPSCLTLYELPSDLVAALSPHGRSLRCAECGHVWRELPPKAAASGEAAPGAASPILAATPASLAAAPADARIDGSGIEQPEATFAEVGPAAPQPSSFDRALPPLAVPGEDRPPAGRAVWVGWTVSVLLVVGLLVAAWVERAAVMRAAPATVPLYHALGAGLPPTHR